jgi:hypothetical protein
MKNSTKQRTLECEDCFEKINGKVIFLFSPATSFMNKESAPFCEDCAKERIADGWKIDNK